MAAVVAMLQRAVVRTMVAVLLVLALVVVAV